jgi:hypothetical protein
MTDEQIKEIMALVYRLERLMNRKGELWSRYQGNGWPEAESDEFTNIRDAHVPATRKDIESALRAAVPDVPKGYVKASESMDVRQFYASLCDAVDEAGAVDTVIGRPRVLYEKLTRLRDEIGAATNCQIPLEASPQAPQAAQPVQPIDVPGADSESIPEREVRLQNVASMLIDRLSKTMADQVAQQAGEALKPEPFGWVSMGQIRFSPPEVDHGTYTPVFTHPPQSEQVRKPLSDAEIEAIHMQVCGELHSGVMHLTFEQRIAVARAIERAHNIREN